MNFVKISLGFLEELGASYYPQKVVTFIRRHAYVPTEDLDHNFKPNITTLRDNGVDEHKIVVLVHYQVYVLLTQLQHFNETGEKMKKLGFNPKQTKFVMDLKAFMKISKSIWEKKVGVGRGVFNKSFLKDPICMLISEDKLTTAMKFYVNEMGVDSSIIAENPKVLPYILDDRIIPRCLAHKSLVLKGLIKRAYGLNNFLCLPT